MDKQDYDMMIKTCLRCSICKWIPQVQIKSKEHATICPSMDYFLYHSYSGGGKIILALSMESGRVQPDEIRDIVYKCTACGGCDVSCKVMNRLEPLEIIMTLREKLVERGVGPMPEHQKYIASIQANNNPYNESHEKRHDWLPADVKINPKAKLAYFVGCTSAYRRKEIAITTARVLNEAGIEFCLLGFDEMCCGSPVIRTGDKKSFLKIMNDNLDKIEAKGIEKIVFSCAGCYDTFKVEYPRYRPHDIEIVSASEIFNELIDEHRLNFTRDNPVKITYHDPCHLGRGAEEHEAWDGEAIEMLPLVTLHVPPKPKRCGGNGVYNPPREVLGKIPGIELVEMERIREYSYCCGAGGGVKASFPDFAIHTACNRVMEAESTGASFLVSSCPFCSTNLQDGMRERRSPLQYLDISEAIWLALKGQLGKKKTSEAKNNGLG